MKRTVLSLTVMMVALMMAAQVALAAPPIYCPSSGACHGTSYEDVMYGPDTGTTMYGYGANDYIFGYRGNDVLYGQGGKDWIYGGDDADSLYGGDDDDYLYGDAGPDKYIGWRGNDKLYDRSSSSSDTYFGLSGGGNDVVFDYGGTSDALDVSHLARSEVLISWLDTSDADINLDALRIEQKGATNTVLVRNYFDNSSGLGKGTGVIESIKFKDRTVGFPASEG
jgi:Ca2+-binding RTX toxin-like protein